MKRVRTETARALAELERHARRYRESERTDADLDALIRAVQDDVVPVADFVSALRRVRDLDDFKGLFDAMAGNTIVPELSQIIIGFMGPAALMDLTVVVTGIIMHQAAHIDRIEIYRYMDRFWRMLLERDFQSPFDQRQLDELYSDVKKGDRPYDEETERFINTNFPRRTTRAYPCVTNYIALWDRLGREGRQEEFPYFWKSAYLMSNAFFRGLVDMFSGTYPLENAVEYYLTPSNHSIEKRDTLRHPYATALHIGSAPFVKRQGLLDNWAPTSHQIAIAGNMHDIAQVQIGPIKRVPEDTYGAWNRDGKLIPLREFLDSAVATMPAISSHGGMLYREYRNGHVIHHVHQLALAIGTTATETTYQTQVVYSRILPYKQDAWLEYGGQPHEGKNDESITCPSRSSEDIPARMVMAFSPLVTGQTAVVKPTTTVMPSPPPPAAHTSIHVRGRNLFIDAGPPLRYEYSYATVTNLGPAIAECRPLLVDVGGDLQSVRTDFKEKLHIPPRGRMFLLYDRYASIALRTPVVNVDVGAVDLMDRGAIGMQLVRFLSRAPPPVEPGYSPNAEVIESRHFALRAIDPVAWAHWLRYALLLNDDRYTSMTQISSVSYWDGMPRYFRRQYPGDVFDFMLGNPMMTPEDTRETQEKILVRPPADHGAVLYRDTPQFY